MSFKNTKSVSNNLDPGQAQHFVQPRKTPPYITERLLMGHKEANQTNKVDTSRQRINR